MLGAWLGLLAVGVDRSDIACRTPCPRRQLLSYVAHSGGSRAIGADVYARAAKGVWCAVGRIATGSAERADDTPDALVRAVRLQQRLIIAHAKALHVELRAADTVELGMRARAGTVSNLAASLAFFEGDGAEDPPHAVSLALDVGAVSERAMMTVGFAGVPRTARGGRRGVLGLPSISRDDIYANFASALAPHCAYDRAAARKEIARLLAGDAVVVFGRRGCDGCADAARLLAHAGVRFRAVQLDRWGLVDGARTETNPLHAEIALQTGRATLPSIFVCGRNIGGLDRDDECEGLLSLLETGELECSVVRGVASGWSTACWQQQTAAPGGDRAARAELIGRHRDAY